MTWGSFDLEFSQHRQFIIWQNGGFTIPCVNSKFNLVGIRLPISGSLEYKNKKLYPHLKLTSPKLHLDELPEITLDLENVVIKNSNSTFKGITRIGDWQASISGKGDKQSLEFDGRAQGTWALKGVKIGPMDTQQTLPIKSISGLKIIKNPGEKAYLTFNGGIDVPNQSKMMFNAKIVSQ